jgi:hypothetical protein
MNSKLSGKAIIVIVVSYVAFVMLVDTFAQEAPTITPAPSKTAAATESNSATPEPVESDEVDTTISIPFTQSDLAILSGNVQRPNGIAWYSDKLYTVCSGDWTLYEIEDTTGSTRTFIYGVRNAHSLHVEADSQSDSDFELWVPDYDTNTLLRVNPTGAPRPIATGLEGPWGISELDEEHFLISNLIGDSIVMVSRTGEITTINSQMRSPAGIVVDDDFVYVANNGSSRRSIEWAAIEDIVDDDTNFKPLVSGLQNTTGIVLAPDGLLYFAYALGTRGVVGRVDPRVCQENGGCTNDEVEMVLYTELVAPLAGLTITPDMRLFVHTIFQPEIYWLQLDSQEDLEQNE